MSFTAADVESAWEIIAQGKTICQYFAASSLQTFLAYQWVLKCVCPSTDKYAFCPVNVSSQNSAALIP